MREYAPVAVVATAVCLLIATVCVRFFGAGGPQPIVITLEPAVIAQLRQGEVQLELLHARGEAQAVVTKWRTRGSSNLVVYSLTGPSQTVTYSYLLIEWPNGTATLHEVHVQVAAGRAADLPGDTHVPERFLGV